MANAIIAAIMSFIIPGLGQLYTGQLIKAIIMFVIWLIVGGASLFLGIPISLLVSIYAAYDAYKSV